MICKRFGLIGYPLTHSFSKKYFTERFKKENTPNCQYDLFELKDLSELPRLIEQTPHLIGLNVTIPYKQKVIPFLDQLDPAASSMGAVNVIKLHNGKLTGYNSDYYGFKKTLEIWLPAHFSCQALVLGSGGASQAVCMALTDVGIGYTRVSRSKKERMITYKDLAKNPQIVEKARLIVNTTPVGTYPKVKNYPELPYAFISSDHFLYDLVYNPQITSFMQKGKDQGASTINGYTMLVAQAEKSWEIWNTNLYE